MATNESAFESHGSGIDSLQSTNNQQSKPTPNTVPKSHELLIKNTFSSLTNTNDDDEKTTDTTSTRKDRVKKAGIKLLLENKGGILKTIAPGNFAKKTYCYKMITGDNIQYFVKIFEDSTMSPTKVAKTLFTNKKLKNRLAPYLLLPAFKPSKTRLDRHTYEIVIYPYIKHCNLEDLTLKALRQGYINPEYHTTKGPPHAPGYKMRLLRRFEQCVTIAIQLKDGGDGYVDMDISPDNFIITTDIDDAVDNDDIRWDKITDSKDAHCIKIDHESLMRWKEKFNRVEKPMKTPFKAPEVNSKDIDGDDKDEYKEFDAEKANVYQFGTTFIYVLYGQLQDEDENGDLYWKSLPYKGKGSWKKLNWSPKYMDKDMIWLQKCVDKRPQKRPNYEDLLRNIKWELKKLTPPPNSGRSRNIPSASSNRPRRNDFNQSPVIQDNRAVTIIFNPHSIQQQQQQQQQQQDQYIKQQQYYGKQQSMQTPQNSLYRYQQQNKRKQQMQNQQNQIHHQQQQQQQQQQQPRQQYMNRQRLNQNNNRNLRQQPMQQNMSGLQRHHMNRQQFNNNFPAQQQQQQQRRLNANKAFNNNGNQRRNTRR